jgi:hypothetical protein
MKTKSKAKIKVIKQKRTYNKDSVKRKIFNIKTDMKHLSKMFTKLQNDIDILREIAKKK